MLLNEDLVKLLLTILALNRVDLLALHIYLYIHLSLLAFSLILLHGFDGSSEVLRSSFPVLACLLKSLPSGGSHLLFLPHFLLLGDGGLYLMKVTCSFETNLLASELNSFLFDMKTNLQALACFSSAFLLNFRPQPSGHCTRSF